MKRSAFALVVLTLAAVVASGDQWRDVDVESLIANAPDEEAYPDAAALLLNLQEMTEVAEDGSTVTTRNRLTRILTLRGRERYSNQSFLYDTERTTVELVSGSTVRMSGRVVEVEEDGMNDVTPAFLEGATIYANVLEKVISFPVAGPGSTMNSQIREETTASKDGSFSGIEYMGASDPILAAEFTLRYPEADGEPAVAILNGHLGDVEIARASGKGELSFRIEDVPGLVEEEHMPPATELYPRVLYSSYGDWGEAASFLAGEFFPHVQTDGEIAAHVASITEGLSSEEDRVRAIYLDVTTNVRNVFLNLGIGGYEPNDAATVLSNRYADTRDKAVLLVSALRSAGVDAYPAAVERARVRFVRDVPTLRQFDRLLVALPEADGYRFLDPLLDDARYGFLRWGRGNTALVVRDDGSGELVEIPPFDPTENSASMNMAVSIEAGGSARISASCELSGFFDRKARQTLKDATPSERQKVFDATANAASAGAADAGHECSDLADLTAPVTVSQDIEAPDFAVPQGDMMIVRVPRFPFDFASTGVYPSLATRRYPFEMPCESTSSLRVDLRIPEGYEVVRMPDPVSLRSAAGDFEISCEWDGDERTVTFVRTVTLKKMTVPVEDYGAFKKDHDTLASPKNGLVLLRKV